jgi:CRISPR-associated protein Csm1
MKIADLIPPNDLFHHDDTLVNMAAKHHHPSTHLQWVVAIADRMASGFEREQFETEYNQKEESPNFLRARLMSPFEMVSDQFLNGKKDHETKSTYRYPLKPLTAGNSVFPDKKEKIVPNNDDLAKQQYADLWAQFMNQAKSIRHLPINGIFLEAMDSLMMTYTSYIPSATAFGTMPSVSLYDHSKATAAFATALYQYHLEHPAKNINAKTEWEKEKFLLIQGDFFGIQDFIFNHNEENNHGVAKMLRGKSAMVTLMTELVALTITETLELASCSIVQNAAGKILLVAANTETTLTRLNDLQKKLNEWFLHHTYGQSGIGLAWVPASCQHFSKKELQSLMDRLFDALEDKKAQKFDLQNLDSPIFSHYLKDLEGVEPCISCSIRPTKMDKQCILCSEFERLGKTLANSAKLSLAIRPSNQERSFLGWSWAMADHPEKDMVRLWDITLPSEGDSTVFHGLPKRFLQAFVPFTSDQDSNEPRPMTFEEIAAMAKGLNGKGKEALAVLKADVDNLGALFGERLPKTGELTFAKVNMVSRAIDQFFSLHLPYLIKKSGFSIYTVFAGGDDLFLIGPWDEVFLFLKPLTNQFQEFFLSDLSKISFSAGLAMFKPKTPMAFMAEQAEGELEHIKKSGKNGLRAFGNHLSFAKTNQGSSPFENIMAAAEHLASQREKLNISSGFLYRLPELARMREQSKKDPYATTWNAKFRYLAARTLVDAQKGDREKTEAAEVLTTWIGNQIQDLGAGFEVSLFKIMYKERES